jgi:hypothetical protein
MSWDLTIQRSRANLGGFFMFEKQSVENQFRR